MKPEPCVVRIPSNLHVCFLNRACSLIPPFSLCKSTGDATREKCNKTNSCSQRCARLCTGAFCLLAAHPLSFHLSVIPPHVLSFALYIHLSPGVCVFFFQCLHTPAVVIKFLPQMRQRQRRSSCSGICLITDLMLRRSADLCVPREQGGDVSFQWPQQIHKKGEESPAKKKKKKRRSGSQLDFGAQSSLSFIQQREGDPCRLQRVCAVRDHCRMHQ